jgi:hypothetical protein
LLNVERIRYERHQVLITLVLLNVQTSGTSAEKYSRACVVMAVTISSRHLPSSRRIIPSSYARLSSAK